MARFVLAAGSLVAVAPTTQPQPGANQDDYIVTLSDNLAENNVHSYVQWAAGIHEHHRRSLAVLSTGGLSHIYTGALNGYAGNFDEATIDKIRAHPDIIRMEADEPVHIRTVRYERRDTVTEKVNPYDPKAIFS